MFGQSVLFGQPSDDPNINMQTYSQALLYAQQNPNNPQAQRQAAYWHEIIQRQTQTMANGMSTVNAGSVPNLTSAPQTPSGLSAPQVPSTVPTSGVPTGLTMNAGFH